MVAISVTKKSPSAFRTISEVSDVLDIPAHVLRFWESKFTQIKPVKRGGGRRYYRPQDINLLRGIRDLLYSDKLTIKGVQKILRERGVRYVAGIGNDETAVVAPREAQTDVQVPDDYQGDLFGGASEPPKRPFPPDPNEPGRMTPEKRTKLKKILGELEVLRDAMKAQEW